MAKVSVVIPVYGVEKYIERCAVSLFEQTLDDIEFIFIDDCTPDESIKILRGVIQRYPARIKQTRIERMPQNSGLAAVRKYGVSIATGEYILPCDSDDYIEINTCEELFNYAKGNGLDLVQCDIDIINDRGIVKTLSSDKLSLTSDEIKKEIIEGKISNSLCNKLVKRELYQDIRIKFPKYGMDEDCTVAVQLAYLAESLGYIKKSFYKAYVNTSSMSRIVGKEQAIKRFNESKVNSDILLDFLDSQGVEKDCLAVINAKIRPKMAIWPVLNLSNRKVWMNTYPDTNFTIVRDRRIWRNTRLKFLLVLSYIYPFYNTLRELLLKGKKHN